ncbi:MAG TPA: hypothetical protein VF078_09540 [Nitrospira sp.]
MTPRDTSEPVGTDGRMTVRTTIAPSSDITRDRFDGGSAESP